VDETTAHLRRVAERVAAAYRARTDARAILLTGSAAEGGGDLHSDVDMLVYYADEPPAEERLASVRAAAGAQLAALAREHGVSINAVWNIARGLTWAHLESEAA
jgi:predicted nucleotidyltransferase